MPCFVKRLSSQNPVTLYHPLFLMLFKIMMSNCDIFHFLKLMSYQGNEGRIPKLILRAASSPISKTANYLTKYGLK